MDYIWNEIKNVYMEYNLDDLTITIFGREVYPLRSIIG